MNEMKKMILILLAMVIGLILGLNKVYAQKVCYQNICLGMDWKEYAKIAAENNSALPTIDQLQKDYELAPQNLDDFLNVRLSNPIPTDIGNLIVKFSDGKLSSVQIFIRADLIKSVIDAVHEKWGKPHAKGDKIYQNRFGAKIEGWVEKWTIGGNVVLLMKIPRKIDEIIYVYTLQTQKQFDKDNPRQEKPIL